MDELEYVNAPELDGKYIGTITSDFIKVSDHLKEASFQLRQQNITAYPIFVVSKEVVPIGQLLLGQLDLDLSWNYFASLLEEFTQRGLVDPDKTEDFIASYKNPDEFCCLFVVDETFVNFVYIPFPEDSELR